MRIGIDAHAAENDGTGNCTYIRNLILHLLKIDRDNSYVIFATNPQHSFYANLKDRTNARIVSIRRSPAWFRVFFALPRAARREKIDVLHVQYFAPFQKKIPCVNMIHDAAWMRFPEHFSRFERLMFQSLVPPSARTARLVLAASNTARSDLIAGLHLQPEKVRVTYSAVSPRFAAELPTQHGVLDICSQYGLDRKFILYVGRIDPRKNLVRLIHAYSLLRTRYPVDHQLAIAGKTYLEPQELQRSLQDCEYRDDVRFCGYVPEDDLPALYRSADAFVYVSEYEGFGLPPLEAMAAGTPVLASDIPIFSETLSDAALLVNPFDINAIADGLHKILCDQPFREERIAKGKERAASFTWENTARLTLQAYQDAVNRTS